MDRPPTEALRAGLRRVRLATASLGVAALLGTGALTWAVASEETTTATAEATTDATAGSTTDDSATTTDDTSASSGTTLDGDDSDTPADASSGGS